MENALINIDSKYRNKIIYPNAGKFSIKLGDKIKNVEYIKITSIEFPNFYYTFEQKKNNTSFIININSNSYIVQISNGNYTNTSLINKINNILTSLSLPTFNFNDNNLLKIIHSNNFTLDFSTFNIYESLGTILGFSNNIYNSQYDNINNNYYIQAENQLNIPNDNYIFIRINDYGIIYNTDKILDKYIQLDTSYRLNKNTYLGKIILNKKNEYVYDNKNFITKQYIFRQRVNIDRFDIELLDPYFNTIDMNNLDYSLTLELGYLI